MPYGAAQKKFDAKRSAISRAARAERAISQKCAHCGGALTVLARGNFPKYCSVDCRDDARNIRNLTDEARKKQKSKRYREHERFARYGLTREDYDKMLADQGGSCAICHTITDSMHIDHDHESGRVRSLLCGPCNQGLGFFRDNIFLLSSAARYLSGWSP